MNKTAIKNFAIEARKSLIAMAVTRSGVLGITAEGIATASQSGQGFEVYPTHFGTETTLTGKEVQSRVRLVSEIEAKGFEQVMEEVAYTWFNRLIAIRFMEVNDYLPSRVRVLSSETAGKLEPDLVTLAPSDVEMNFTSAEIDAIYAMKDDPRRSGELFRTLFIKQCNLLGDILPNLFEKTTDYTELLLDIAWDKEDGVVRQLLTIDEGDFLEAVEIVGWMYQYYNTEPKETVFANLKKNIKISKENIPAATQLFTPDWIVRYMVENSLGRIAVDKLGLDPVAMGWKYYLPEAEQTPEVVAQLKVLSDGEHFQLEELKVIDPCMGSGHILVYAFDVLMQIYEHRGYTSRDAVWHILNENLYGLDIDLRAYQMAYFAVMMKARSYDRRFLTRNIPPQLYCPTGYPDGEEFGSLLTVDELEEMPAEPEEISFFNQNYDVQMNCWNFRRLLAQKYDVVVTNPPYMGGSGMSSKLSDFVKKEYPDSKSDMFACFIERGNEMAKPHGYNAMVTMQSWMFLSSFEKMRQKIINTKTISNLMHMENMVMGIAFGTAVTIIKNAKIADYKGTYNHITMKDIGNDGVPSAFPVMTNRFAQVSTENFSKIPGSPIAYWVSEGMLRAFENETVGIRATTRLGMSTANNDKFMRNWYEVLLPKIGFGYATSKDAMESFKKWFPYNKGGAFRKWYGNLFYVVNWENDGFEIRNFIDEKTGRIRSHNYNLEYIFKKSITWADVTSGSIGFRYSDIGSLFDGRGSSMFTAKEDIYYILGFLCTPIVECLVNIINPTIAFNVGEVAKLPLLISSDDKENVDVLVQRNIALSRTDWDSFETSWDFQRHPLI